MSLKRSNIGMKLLWTKYSITRVHIHLEGISKLEKGSTPNDILRNVKFCVPRLVVDIRLVFVFMAKRA